MYGLRSPVLKSTVMSITMDLRTGEHKSYMKPNNTPLYEHNKSNNPPNIITNIPENIKRRLSNISSNEKNFQKAIPPYQDALKKSGYNYKLEYKPTPTDNNNQNNNQKNKIKRNITWFNLPYILLHRPVQSIEKKSSWNSL